MKRTVSLNEAYSRDPYFGGKQIGWTVRIFVDKKLVEWRTYKSKEDAKNRVKSFRKYGYDFEFTSHDHYLIDQEIKVEVGE